MGFRWAIAPFFFSVGALAACPIKNSDGSATKAKGDALYAVLSTVESCPTRAQDLKALLQSNGLAVKPAIVANRGRHNPQLGSFSFFEEVTGELGGRKLEKGDFFFGHFTGAEGGVVGLDQSPDEGKLLVELLAEDPAKKGLYNFYELIGNGGSAQWFYRGDSADALSDNALLYRTAPGAPKFGNRMRCSACHSSGGPIMKELAPPFNDWWTAARPLGLGDNQPSEELKRWLKELVDAKDFAASVTAGMERLAKSEGMKAAKTKRTLAERLRPVFCDTEINLVSDATPLDGAVESTSVPSGFVVSPFWGDSVLTVSKADYLALLAKRKMRFPETRRPDADHAWLSPVKGKADLLAIQALIDEGTISEELVSDILAIDKESSLFSKDRCALLGFVPESTERWQEKFEEALDGASQPAAKALLKNLREPSLDKAAHQKSAKAFVEKAKQSLETDAGRLALFDKLIKARKSVFEAEISKNPRGQILEPGFRVIFALPQ